MFISVQADSPLKNEKRHQIRLEKSIKAEYWGWGLLMGKKVIECEKIVKANFGNPNKEHVFLQDKLSGEALGFQEFAIVCAKG